MECKVGWRDIGVNVQGVDQGAKEEAGLWEKWCTLDGMGTTGKKGGVFPKIVEFGVHTLGLEATELDYEVLILMQI